MKGHEEECSFLSLRVILCDFVDRITIPPAR
jgi:hypothetical protein